MTVSAADTRLTIEVILACAYAGVDMPVKVSNTVRRVRLVPSVPDYLGVRMPIPNELHMPSLEDLGSNLPSHIVTLLIGQGPSDELLRRHFNSAIRLVNLSIREYELARQHLEESLPGAGGGNRLGPFLLATDHLELCVISVYRAVNACVTIWHHPQMKPYWKSRDREVRQVRREVEAFREQQLRSVRRLVTHVEKAIAKGEIAHGEPHVLTVSKDGRTASIGGRSISLEGLSVAIRQVHQLAKDLSLYRRDAGS